MGRPQLEELLREEREQWLLDRGFNPESAPWGKYGHSSEGYQPPIENIEPTYNYVTHELGLDVKVFDKFPKLFGYSVEDNLKPKVDYITKELGLDVKVFDKRPQLFGYSVEDNLKPKYHYLTTEMRADNFALEKSPATFSLSLKNRIIPRWEFAKHKSQTNFSLSYLLFPNDSKFAERLGSDAAHYHAFRDENKDFIEDIYKSLVEVVMIEA